MRAEKTLENKSEAGAPESHVWHYVRRPQRSEALAADAARLIHQRLVDVHSVTEVSALLGVSREHLSRMFKRHLGCSVWSFMTTLRIERAKELLRGSMLVKQVGKEVGFRSDSSFGRAFVRSVGVQPAEYRRRITSNSNNQRNSSSTDRRHS